LFYLGSSEDVVHGLLLEAYLGQQEQVPEIPLHVCLGLTEEGLRHGKRRYQKKGLNRRRDTSDNYNSLRRRGRSYDGPSEKFLHDLGRAGYSFEDFSEPYKRTKCRKSAPQEPLLKPARLTKVKRSDLFERARRSGGPRRPPVPNAKAAVKRPRVRLAPVNEGYYRLMTERHGVLL
jgi:hypothetical protein